MVGVGVTYRTAEGQSEVDKQKPKVPLITAVEGTVRAAANTAYTEITFQGSTTATDNTVTLIC